ncbi:MAG: hypothetical protein K2Y37_26685 [Pirellulales bacterium]|nr:hypothetical protein [Pirellulales bacterium]
MPMSIPTAWLSRQSTVDALESEFEYDGIVFGHCHSEWQQLKAKIRPGDELWYFISPPETWTGFPRCGMEGITLRRHGQTIDNVLLSLS